MNSKQPKKVQLIPHFEILIGASQDPAQLIVWTPDPSGHAVRRVWGPEYSINMSRIRFKSSHLVQCLRKGPLKKHRRLAKAIVITCDYMWLRAFATPTLWECLRMRRSWTLTPKLHCGPQCSFGVKVQLLRMRKHSQLASSQKWRLEVATLRCLSSLPIHLKVCVLIPPYYQWLTEGAGRAFWTSDISRIICRCRL